MKSIVARHRSRIAKLINFGYSFTEAVLRADLEVSFRMWLDYTKHGDAFFPAGLTFNQYLNTRELIARQMQDWRLPQ